MMDSMDPLKPSCTAIQRLSIAEGTEHTLRGALEALLNALRGLCEQKQVSSGGRKIRDFLVESTAWTQN